MNVLRHLPNALTLANLTCGSVAAVFIIQSFDETLAVLLIFAAAFFDLLDGAAARLMRVNGELGKQLDSLADVISFGLVPSVIIYLMLERGLPAETQWLKYTAFINVACAALRLARFNTQESGQTTFNGMPSPANGIFWASLLAITAWEKHQLDGSSHDVDLNWPVQLVLTLLMATSVLMVSNIRMFSFKFKPGGWNNNKTPLAFLLLAVAIIVCSLIMLNNVLMAIPVIVMAYILFSITSHFLNPTT
jgi:CDP-diacylglycerol--serine O-phosphatidyltransferase